MDNEAQDSISPVGDAPPGAWQLITNGMYNGHDQIMLPRAGNLFVAIDWVGDLDPSVGIYTGNDHWIKLPRGQSYTDVNAGDQLYWELKNPAVDTVDITFAYVD